MARVTRIGPGVYRVNRSDGDDSAENGGHDIVYVAGTPGDTWAFWKGHIFRPSPLANQQPGRPRAPRATQALTSPMPATVVKVLAEPGQTVKSGDTLVIVEAMKMELPVRAPSDAVVKAVRCRERDVVQADQTLVELE
jgi:acetyl-CoA/propionyl-CoA carboxylase, biotin carboxylase, biotin carboxyl carrier protein